MIKLLAQFGIIMKLVNFQPGFGRAILISQLKVFQLCLNHILYQLKCQPIFQLFSTQLKLMLAFQKITWYNDYIQLKEVNKWKQSQNVS